LTFTNFAISHYFRDYDINLGLNFKTFFQSIDDYYASTAGLDFGITFPLKSKEYLWGISNKILSIGLPIRISVGGYGARL